MHRAWLWIGLAACGPQGDVVTQAPLPPSGNGVALIGVQDSAAEAKVEAAVEALGGRVTLCFHLARVCLASFDPAAPLPLDALRALPGVRYADPDARMDVQAPLDLRPLFVNPAGTAACPDLWDLASIEVGDAWTEANDRGAQAPVVAIQDSGFRLTHHAFSSAVWGQFDYGDLDPIAEVSWSAGVPGHGTFIAGMLVDEDDGQGRVGVLPDGRLNLQKIADSSGALYFSYAIAAMADTAQGDLGVRVVNYSIAGPSSTTAFADAVAALGAADIVLVAAAGNCSTAGCSAANNDAVPLYPASYTGAHILSVAGHRRDGSLNPFSHYGATSVDLAAPGVDLCAPGVFTDTDYFVSAGTSYATPLVAGTAALVLGAWPRLRAEEVVRVIRSSAAPQPALAGLMVSGGSLSAARAVRTAVPRLAEPVDVVVDGYATIGLEVDSVAAEGEGTIVLLSDEAVAWVRATSPGWSLRAFEAGEVVPLPGQGPWVATSAGALLEGPLPADAAQVVEVELRAYAVDSFPVTARVVASSSGASAVRSPVSGGLDATGERAWTFYVDVARALPPAELLLSVSPMRPGDPVSFSVSGARPGDVVRFARGTGVGNGLCPAFAVDRCFHLLGPTAIGVATANAQGVATLQRVLPASLPVGRQVPVQAVVAADGGLWSELVLRETLP